MNPSTGNGFDNMNPGGQGDYGVGGDIILSPSGTTEKKNGKKTILIVVVFLMLAVVVTLLLVWLFGFGGIKDLQGNKLKRSFNSYVNYVVLGKESDEDFNLEILDEESYYARLSSDQKEQYLSVADTKYESFKDLYYNEGGYENIYLMKVYFQDFAGLSLSIDGLYESLPDTYARLGLDGANKEVKDSFKGITGDFYLVKYANIEEKLGEIRLVALERTSMVDCLLNDSLSEECNTFFQESDGNYASLLSDAVELRRRIRRDALNVLRTVYDSLYKDRMVENV